MCLFHIPQTIQLLRSNVWLNIPYDFSFFFLLNKYIVKLFFYLPHEKKIKSILFVLCFLIAFFYRNELNVQRLKSILTNTKHETLLNFFCFVCITIQLLDITNTKKKTKYICTIWYYSLNIRPNNNVFLQ